MSAKFNTLKFTQELEAAGFEKSLSQKFTNLLHDEALGSVATKEDLKALEQSLTIKFGTMIVVAVGVLIAAQKFL